MLSGVPKETGTFTYSVRANDAVAKVTLSIDSGASKTYSQNPVPRYSASVGSGLSFYLYNNLAVSREASHSALWMARFPRVCNSHRTA